MNFSVIFCVERALESTKLAIPEQLELQILLVSPKHGRVQIRTFSSGKSLGSLKTKILPLVFMEQFISIIQAQWISEIFLSRNVLFLKKHIFFLDNLEQLFLSAYFTTSQSILGQSQGKNCNRPMLITASYLFLTRGSPGSS